VPRLLKYLIVLFVLLPVALIAFALAAGPAAEKVQSLLAEGAGEQAFMPEVRDLPEFMQEAEFVRRFGGVGAPAYERVAGDIEQRISALAIHR
jgi:hypothetical protein